MAQTKLKSVFFFLAIILSQKFQSTEGRNLTFKNKKQLQTRTKISMHDSIKYTPNGSNLLTDCSRVSACGNEAVFTAPPPSPDAAEAQPPPPGGHADDFRPTTPGHSPGIGHADDFRPTTPGNSPGIGHSDDFRPTTPGHSPGIGHS